MKKGKCIVIRDEMTVEELKEIRKCQKNTSTQNCRVGGESAFTKALNGSKIYLKEQGYISGTEE